MTLQLHNHQHQLEKKILGSIISLESLDQQMHYLSQLGSDKYFTSDTYRELIATIISLVFTEKCVVDQVNLFGYMKKYAKEITEAAHEYVSTAFLERDIMDLIIRHYHKNLLNDLDKASKELYDAVTLTEIEKAKNNIVLTLSSRFANNESEILDFNKLEVLLQENLSHSKISRIDGHSFGITDLDLVTNGIGIPKLYAVGALKKAGKTRFVINTIRELYKQQIPLAFLSLEVPEYEVYKLLKSSFAGIDDQKLRAGNLKYLSKQEIIALESICFDPNRLMIECNSGLNLTEIWQRLRKYSKLGAKVIFIDYFQRIKHDINNKVNELEEIAQRLADASREFNISVFILSQLSNLAERETPSISHLKGTGGLGEAADTIMIMDNVYRRTGNEKYLNRIDCEITQRYGESGKITLYADLGKSYFNNYSNEII